MTAPSVKVLALAVLTLFVCVSCARDAGETDDQGFELNAYGLLTGTRNEVSAALLARELRFQEAVADCMRAEGFDYFPRDDTAEEEAASEIRAPGTVPGVIPVEWAMEHGFGISEMLLASMDRSPFGSGLVDLNEEYTATLTAEELRAYAGALGDCERSSGDLVGFDAVEESMDLAELVAEEVEERLEADELVASLEGEWAACYVASGGWYNYQAGEPGSPAELFEQFAMTVYSDNEVSEPGRSQYEELFELERSAATLSAKCAEEIDFDRSFTSARNSYIETLLEAHGGG